MTLAPIEAFGRDGNRLDGEATKAGLAPKNSEVAMPKLDLSNVEKQCARLRRAEEATGAMLEAVGSSSYLVNPDGPEAADTLEQQAAEVLRLSKVEEAARALVAKLDECAPHVANAFLMEEMRGRPYSGPQYGEALEQLRATLSEKQP